MSEHKQEQQDLRELLDASRRRLQALKLQAARQGYDTKPHILTEIAQIETDISKLEVRLSTLNAESAAPTDADRNTLSSIQIAVNELESQIRDQESGQFTLFRTNVSQAFWYLAAGAEQKRPFIPAVMSKPQVKGSEDPSTFAWFDELLRDGLYLPNGENRPLTMVVAGPPGSGKTTLALEMCYRLAKDETGENPGRLFSLYISLDQDTDL